MASSSAFVCKLCVPPITTDHRFNTSSSNIIKWIMFCKAHPLVDNVNDKDLGFFGLNFFIT